MVKARGEMRNKKSDWDNRLSMFCITSAARFG